MKKSLFFAALLTLFLTFVGTYDVSAKSCTKIKAIPHMYQVAPEKTTLPSDPLTTSENTCKGTNTEVWFSSIKSMPDNWNYATGTIHIKLYEEDPPGNPDELVKTYYGSVVNKTITSITLSSVDTPGNIDSVGDQTCELYLQFYSSGKYGASIEKSLFNRQICMN